MDAGQADDCRRAEALEIVKDIGFEAFELLLGETIDDDDKARKPN